MYKRQAFIQRLYTSLDLSIAVEDTNLNKGLSFLASSGSVAPFIGLFGTVWGIMNSFQAIAIAQNTNLAVVAPGIAEALFVTALGLKQLQIKPLLYRVQLQRD